MIIPDKLNFQPSNETVNKWLETRKADFVSLANSRVKPLLSDVGVKEDRFWFRLALSIEFAALLATFYGGAKSGGIFAIIAILIVFGLVILDFVVAKLLHKRVAEITKLKAEIEQVTYFKPAEKESKVYELNKLLSKDTFYNRLYLFALIIMAFIKIAAIFLLGAFNEMVIYYIFFALYMVVVYVHYKHTGHYMAYAGFGGVIKGVENMIDKDYDEHVADKSNNKNAKEGKVNIKNSTKKNREVFSVNKALYDVPIKHSYGHLIKKIDDIDSEVDIEDDGNLDKKHKYVLITNGILTDDELIELTNGQEDENMITIFMTGRKLQLKSFL